MKNKSLLAYAALTVAALIAAIAVTWQKPHPSLVIRGKEPAFIELRKDPNAVAKLSVTGSESSFTLVREEDGRWVAPDRFGYRVAQDKVRDLVVALSDMRLVEAKTLRDDRYARLAVDDPSKEGSEALQITLEDAQGAVLTDVIIGKRVYRKTGGKPGGTYLRRSGEAQSWLASGGLTVAKQLSEWLDRGIIDIAGSLVERVEVSLADGDYAVLRDGEDSLALEATPEGRTVVKTELDRMVNGLIGLRLDDVIPVAQLEAVGSDSLASTTYVTKAGLAVTVTLTRAAEDNWIVLKAAYRAGQSQDDEETAKAEAEALNTKLSPWAYKVASYVADRFTVKLEDLLEPKEGTS